MRRFHVLILLAMTVLLPSMSHAELQPKVAPYSAAYLEWLAQQEESSVPNNKSVPGESSNATGYIPFHIDMSHLADNPPRELFPNDKTDSASDSKYSLKDDGFVTSVKDQNPYGSCWAHAAIGAMESNYLLQGKTAIPSANLDLSELHLVYFTFNNSTSTKAFSGASGLKAALDHGGNAFYPTALYSRLDGPVLESELPYTSTPLKSTPESYERVMRVKDAFYLAMGNGNNDVISSTQRANVKKRIVENGGVVASYYNADSNYNDDNTACYVTTQSTNHAVLIVGWDDNYSKSNFKKNPGMDGAWLIKNSWGTDWGDDGYFWMSYASYLTDGTAFVVDDVDDDLNVYYYDALGWTSNWGYSVENMMAANAFKSNRDDEVLSEIGLYTPDNNVTCEISVYTDLGSSLPSSPAPSGNLALKQTETIPFAGYHTIELDDSVALTNGEYFSVVVKYTGQSMIPVEMKASMGKPSIEAGSFFSYNEGSSWVAGTTYSVNATIKAFTTTDPGDTPPTISTTSLSDATKNVAYSAKLRAKGKKPITWSIISGSLPDGLTLDESTGTISGTPTAVETATFTVKASNDLGSADKTLTLNVSNLPVITTTAITGYVGYELDEQLELNTTSLSATWACDNLSTYKDLKKLKLSSSGNLTGKPSKAGTYSLNVSATTSAGTSTGTVTLTVENKPTAAKIKTSKLTQINIGDTVNQTLEYSGTEPINFEVEDMPAGLAFDAGTATFSGTPTETGTFKILVTASNIVNELSGKEARPKKITLVVKAQAPVINAPTSLPSGIVGEAYTPTQITLSSGSDPEKWSASGLPKGLTISKDTGIISGTPQKAGTFNVAIQGQNNGGKDKTDKIPLVVYEPPEITVKRLKDGTAGKAYSVKLTAKGSPEWEIDGLPDGLELSADKKDNPVIAGTPTTPGTSSVKLTATNIVGSDDETLSLKIKGVAPKIKATLPKNATINSAYKATIEVTGTLPLTQLSYDIAAADLVKANLESLEELGLTFSANLATGIATITGTPKYGVKGLAVQVIASNAEKSNVKKKVSIKIPGTKPTITTPSDKAVTQTLAAGASVDITFVCSGTQKIKWSMKALSGFTLSQDVSNPLSARLIGKMPSSGKVSTTITAENSAGKASKKVTLTVGSASASGLDDVESSEPEQEAQEQEQGLSVGAERSAGDIGRAEREAIEREGYTVVAVLPEVSADVEGMYDFDVELDSGAEVGRKLVWLAFPQNAEASEDDEIAEFWDESGVETEVVPESPKVKVSVWLREGVRYAPVIAVK